MVSDKGIKNGVLNTYERLPPSVKWSCVTSHLFPISSELHHCKRPVFSKYSWEDRKKKKQVPSGVLRTLYLLWSATVPCLASSLVSIWSFCSQWCRVEVKLNWSEVSRPKVQPFWKKCWIERKVLKARKKKKKKKKKKMSLWRSDLKRKLTFTKLFNERERKRLKWHQQKKGAEEDFDFERNFIGQLKLSHVTSSWAGIEKIYNFSCYWDLFGRWGESNHVGW